MLRLYWVVLTTIHAIRRTDGRTTWISGDTHASRGTDIAG
jgi:hypothetical protein